MKNRVVGLSVLIWIVFCRAVAGEMPQEKRFSNSLGMEFVRVEPGTFRMGVGETPLPQNITEAYRVGNGQRIYLPENGDYDEKPARKVSITKPFYMGITEVTNQQYERFDPRHVYVRGKNGFSIDNDEAVVFVSWTDAKAFCDWLSKKEGLPYRLPTEAEWEYACRAGTTTHFSTGDTLPSEFLKNPDSSWYPDPERGRGREEVVPLHVAETPPNPWGLYDMHGNVEEWCADWYGPYQAEDSVDPVGRRSGDFRVTRGGSHGTVAFYLRSENRMGTLPEERSWMIGFRVVLGEPPKTKPLPPVACPLNQQNVRQDRPSTLDRGPDPGKPYFHGPIPYVHIPDGSEGPLFSRHNHVPALVECPNGDLLAVWYSTVMESGRELGLAASRLRYGSDVWEPASPFWNAPDRNDHAPALWYDGEGTLFHFVGLSTAATWGPLAIVLRTSKDSGATWSKARLILPEHGRRHAPVETVLRTKEGAILVPCDAVTGGNGGTALQVSFDNGATWSDPGGTIAGIHAGVVQLKDGRLLAFGRGDTIDGRMPKSISSDLGKSWTSEPSDFSPIGGGQRLVLIRLHEGPLFFASFANTPMSITDSSGASRQVTGLFAALSYDEGKTWPVRRLISDDGPGREVETIDGNRFVLSRSSAEPKGYLSICQGTNKVIHLISSREYYAFNLKWVEADRK